MPYKENMPLKRYWTITELSKEMNVATSHIRFYEYELGLTVNRSELNRYRGKERRYKRSQYNNMIFLISLMKTKRFTVYGAWEYVKEYRKALKVS